MWPILAAAGKVGSALLGSTLLPAVSSAFGQHQANKQNVQLSREGMAFEADQVQKQMQFQERMSNSSYQRGMEDMRLAGINPMLAYAQGGASTPGGGAASGSAATVQDVIGPAVASAQHARRLNEEIKSIQAGTAATAAGTARTGVETDNARIQGDILRENLHSARAAGSRSQIFQPAYNRGIELSRRLFDPRNGRIMNYEIGRLARRAAAVPGNAADRVREISDSLRGAISRSRSRVGDIFR